MALLAELSSIRGPKDQMSMRISHSGSKVQCKQNTRTDILQDSYVFVVVGALSILSSLVCLSGLWNMLLFLTLTIRRIYLKSQTGLRLKRPD